MRLLTTFTLLVICLGATGQTFPAGKDSWYRVDTLFTKRDKSQDMPTFYPGAYLDTESMYSDSTGKGIIIQNSLPKGGGGYTDSNGRTFGYVIFWTRIINETATPLEVTINFPADSFAILSSPDSFLKLFLPADTMTLEKVLLYDYGLTDLGALLDNGLNGPTMLQTVIDPREDFLFYIATLLYQTRGSLRAGLVLKEQNFFYRLNALDSVLIPCGQIAFKD